MKGIGVLSSNYRTSPRDDLPSAMAESERASQISAPPERKVQQLIRLFLQFKKQIPQEKPSPRQNGGREQLLRSANRCRHRQECLDWSKPRRLTRDVTLGGELSRKRSHEKKWGHSRPNILSHIWVFEQGIITLL